MKRPSFQFYPGDWSSNPNLKRCTFAEKGIWLEVLCLMHDQPEYGVLRWPLKEIAEAVKCRVADLQALQRKDVLKGHDQELVEPFIYVPRSGRKDGEPVTLVPAQAGPLWYSSRMVKDEYVRANAGASTRFGAETITAPAAAPKKSAPMTDRAKLRIRVLEKTGGSCYHCDTKLGEVWEIDHLMPRSKGGRHTFANMVPSCVACNQDKSDTLPDDWAALSRSPTHRDGDGVGDGSSSSTSSSTSSPSLRSGDTAVKPRISRSRRELKTLSQFLEACKADGVKPVPLDAAVRAYCRDAGIADEMLQIAWLVFKDRHLNADKDKRYKDWGKTFANSVKDRWYKLWYDDAGEVKWTSTGLQEKRVIEARISKPQQQHDGVPA